MLDQPSVESKDVMPNQMALCKALAVVAVLIVSFRPATTMAQQAVRPDANQSIDQVRPMLPLPVACWQTPSAQVRTRAVRALLHSDLCHAAAQGVVTAYPHLLRRDVKLFSMSERV